MNPFETVMELYPYVFHPAVMVGAFRYQSGGELRADPDSAVS
jgi:hypothetical protein